MRRATRLRPIHLITVVAATLLIGAALWHLWRASDGVTIATDTVDRTPVTVFSPRDRAPIAAVVIAHGFAGSQQLMQSFALTFARNGYVAVTFDLPGHGRNPRPLTGDIANVAGATRVLVDETKRIATYARRYGGGRLAVLGHSMSSDIVVRMAEESPNVAATIAVSMFSPAVTATQPGNLLVIVGDWEGMLKAEALRTVGLATAPAVPEPGVTYGDIQAGTARRAAFSPHVEHASVLFSQASMREALGWLDAAFGVERPAEPSLDDRGPWIMVLLAAIIGLAWPLSRVLPEVAVPPVGGNRHWTQLWLPLLVPMVAVPFVLRLVPTHFLPMLVGDYLAVHFLAYGVLTLITLAATRRGRSLETQAQVSVSALTMAVIAAVGFEFAGFVWPINTFVTSFVPGPERLALFSAMLIGTLTYFLADEWLTRGGRAAWGAFPASKLAFLVSLAIAIALDFERLFFLIIILPVILLFFLIFGLFSRWIYRATGHPCVAAIAHAVLFAWSIGVTFPILAG